MVLSPTSSKILYAQATVPARGWEAVARRAKPMSNSGPKQWDDKHNQNEGRFPRLARRRRRRRSSFKGAEREVRSFRPVLARLCGRDHGPPETRTLIVGRIHLMNAGPAKAFLLPLRTEKRAISCWCGLWRFEPSHAHARIAIRPDPRIRIRRDSNGQGLCRLVPRDRCHPWPTRCICGPNT